MPKGYRSPDGPLTVAERNAVAEAMLAKYPHPVALLAHMKPGAVRRAKSLGVEDEELAAACLAAVAEAARRFDPAKGSFVTIVSWQLWAAARGLIEPRQRDRERLGGRAVLALDAPLSEGGERVGDLIPGRAADPAAAGLRAEAADLVRRAVAKLPHRTWRLVAELRYGLTGGEPLLGPQIAAMIGTTRSRVQQIEVQVRDRLRTLLAGVVEDD